MIVYSEPVFAKQAAPHGPWSAGKCSAWSFPEFPAMHLNSNGACEIHTYKITWHSASESGFVATPDQHSLVPVFPE